jgi:hypothetical protein
MSNATLSLHDVASFVVNEPVELPLYANKTFMSQHIIITLKDGSNFDLAMFLNEKDGQWGNERNE